MWENDKVAQIKLIKGEYGDVVQTNIYLIIYSRPTA